MILIGIILVAAIGFAGYSIYQQRVTKDVTVVDANYKKSSDSKNLTIEAYGVKVPLSSKITGLETASIGNDVWFSTKTLTALGQSHMTGVKNYCSASEGALGVLSRVAVNDPSISAMTIPVVAKVGNYYYYYTSPQGPCSDDAATNDLQTQQLNDLKAALPTLSAS